MQPGTPNTPCTPQTPTPHKACRVLQDLSGGNVMLTSCSINPHGFQAKVGDFGLSREASASARVAGNLYGTITHMAPEVMLQAQAGPVSMPGWGVGGGGKGHDGLLGVTYARGGGVTLMSPSGSGKHADLSFANDSRNDSNDINSSWF